MPLLPIAAGRGMAPGRLLQERRILLVCTVSGTECATPQTDML